jgi:hypothetical protein
MRGNGTKTLQLIDVDDVAENGYDNDDNDNDGEL